MRRKPVATRMAALAFAVSGLTAVATPAGAANAYLVVNDGVFYNGCQSVPIRFTATDLPEGTDRWRLTIVVTAPDGTSTADDPDEFRGSTDLDVDASGTILVCTSAVPGTHVADATFEATDDDEFTVERTDLAPVEFDMRYPRTTTSIKSNRQLRCNDTGTITVRTLEERPAGFFPTSLSFVHLQGRARPGDRWRKIRGTEANAFDGVARIRFTFGPGPCVRQFSIRGVTEADSRRSGSVSQPITFRR